MNSGKFSLKNFSDAWKGIREAATTQFSFRIHLVAAVLVIGAGFLFSISSIEWCLVLFAIAIVVAAECFNTAIEYLTDKISPEYDVKAGKIKDLSAAAVLICAMAAVATGLIIFLPKIF